MRTVRNNATFKVSGDVKESAISSAWGGRGSRRVAREGDALAGSGGRSRHLPGRQGERAL